LAQISPVLINGGDLYSQKVTYVSSLDSSTCVLNTISKTCFDIEDTDSTVCNGNGN
jgi:hypothetical protein